MRSDETQRRKELGARSSSDRGVLIVGRRLKLKVQPTHALPTGRVDRRCREPSMVIFAREDKNLALQASRRADEQVGGSTALLVISNAKLGSEAQGFAQNSWV